MNPVELRELMKDAEVRGQYLASIRHRGKDVLLGDIEKLIEIMIDEAVEIEERKTENAILNQQLSAKTISEQNIINAFCISGEGAHSKLVIEYVHGLVAENARMREAIEFATAPDMWQEQHDGMLDYRYVDWYVDVLNAALEPKSTDAAIAEIKSEEAQNMYESILDNPSVYDMESLVDYLESYAENKKSFAANLRAGRKG